MTDRNRIASADGAVVLTGAHFHCTGCKKVKAAKHFGIRKMQDGRYRNQAQCNECRADYHRLSGTTPRRARIKKAAS